MNQKINLVFLLIALGLFGCRAEDDGGGSQAAQVYAPAPPPPVPQDGIQQDSSSQPKTLPLAFFSVALAAQHGFGIYLGYDGRCHPVTNFIDVPVIDGEPYTRSPMLQGYALIGTVGAQLGTWPAPGTRSPTPQEQVAMRQCDGRFVEPPQVESELPFILPI